MTNEDTSTGLVLKFKKGAIKQYNINKYPKICDQCHLIVYPPPTTFNTNNCTCLNCKRLYNHFKSSNSTSLDEEVITRSRPFDLPTTTNTHTNTHTTITINTNNNNTNNNKNTCLIDEYLKTNKFLDYLIYLNKYIPYYIQTSNVIQTTPNESSYSILGCLTYTNLTNHLNSLRIEHIQRWIRPILSRFINHTKNIYGIFNIPVDTQNLPDYNIKIRAPMDLGTIRSKLQSGGYHNIYSVLYDILLVFTNAIIYNQKECYIYENALYLINEFEGEVKALDEKCIKEVRIMTFTVI